MSGRMLARSREKIRLRRAFQQGLEEIEVELLRDCVLGEAFVVLLVFNICTLQGKDFD